MKEIKKWLVLAMCLIGAIVLVVLAVVILPVAIITKIATRLLKKLRDVIERAVEDYQE